MTRRLPPLIALRAFEAAARHLSFTRAAAELHVTQAAVSHQVKALEDDLGVRLFSRASRRPTLTAAGQTLLPVVSEALDRIGVTYERLRGGDGRGTLTVSLAPYLSAKWLTPRLGRFGERHPEIDLRLHHSVLPVDFARDDIDLAVRWGQGRWSGVDAELLLPMELTPVCSLSLQMGPHRLRQPADLRHHTLLHEVDHGNWIQWLARAGATDVEPQRGPLIDDFTVLVHSAIDGHGVALTPVSLVADHLEAGRLVRPFRLSFLPDAAYYIVYPPGALRHAKVKAFRDWLLAEAAKDHGKGTDAPTSEELVKPGFQGIEGPVRHQASRRKKART